MSQSQFSLETKTEIKCVLRYEFGWKSENEKQLLLSYRVCMQYTKDITFACMGE